MPRKIKDSVVVITGASSGIGRASALAFARQGASVVLAARREGALKEVAEQCRNLGGRAIAVPTDVTDAQAVKELARRAVQEFGRIDVWVNNAAVTLFARFEEAPMDAYRRVIETNLFGYVHGARAALPYFREQGSGVLINNDSMVGKAAEAETSAYVTSKWAILGLTECLRLETHDAKDIHVCAVLPASIDTPLFQNSANYTGCAIKPLPPIYEAEKVADAIVALAQRPRRQTFVGNAGRMAAAFHAVAPGLYERVAAKQTAQGHHQDRPAPPTEGNLFEPIPERATVSGGWNGHPRRKGRTALAGIAATGAVAIAAWQLRNRLRPLLRAIR